MRESEANVMVRFAWLVVAQRQRRQRATVQSGGGDQKQRSKNGAR
jgi:hypothetical protein